MSIYEITNAQYAVYLNEALKSGDIAATSESVRGEGGEYDGQEYIYLAGDFSAYSDAECKIQYSNGSFSVAERRNEKPVKWVTWYGAKAFAEYYGFDLPREAEWEYACRGRKQYEYGTNDGTLNKTNANYGHNVSYPKNAGSYPANPLGLFDMSGNIWEWCADWYGEYPSVSVTDPTGAQSGSERIIRGGSWNSGSFYCHAAVRWVSLPDNRNPDIGFRVVRRKILRNNKPLIELE